MYADTEFFKERCGDDELVSEELVIFVIICIDEKIFLFFSFLFRCKQLKLVSGVCNDGHFNVRVAGIENIIGNAYRRNNILRFRSKFCLRNCGQVECIKIVGLCLFGLFVTLDVERYNAVASTKNAFIKHYFIVNESTASNGFCFQVLGLYVCYQRGNFISVFICFFDGSGNYVELKSLGCGYITVVADCDQERVALAYDNLLCKRFEIDILKRNFFC